MTEIDLKKTVRTLHKFLNHPTISSYESCILAANKLKIIQRDTQETTSTSELLQLTQLRYSEKEIRQKIENYLTVDLLVFGVNHERNYKIHGRNNLRIRYCLSSVIVLIGIGIGLYLGYPATPSTKQTRCMSPYYDSPFNLSLDYDYFLSEHRASFVGRKWLMHELDNLMNDSVRGVLFVADMGYGKTAIVSQLVCQSAQSDAGHNIYKHLIGYHICNRYSRQTLQLDSFVKSLGGAIYKFVPEFKDIVSKDSNFKSYFDVRDPHGSFDFGILNYLRRIPVTRKTYFIIDALDECIMNGESNIVSMLETRLNKFPENFKFLLTSRNISSLISRLKPFTLYEQTSTRRENMKDAEKLFQRKLDATENKDNIMSVFKKQNLSYIIKTGARYANGNMQYLIHAFDYWTTYELVSLEDTPPNIAQLYYFEFKRIFVRQERFEEVRKIFEIVCAALSPVHKKTLFTLANISSEYQQIQTIRLIKNDLRHFIKEENEVYLLMHSSLGTFLTNEKRRFEIFFISKANGSRYFSVYWLNTMKTKKSCDDVDVILVAEYVSKSGCKEYRLTFIKYGISMFKESCLHLIHKTAARLNSYKGMSLIISLNMHTNIDEKDKGNSTAAYIAAAFGHHYSLRALLDFGADLNFSRLGPRIINKTLNIVDFCKLSAHWGYSLINIASQYGHFNVIQVLLKRGVNYLHQNALGMNSFHIAAENGHIALLKMYLEWDKRFAISSLNFSLYLASKEGYANIVGLLLHHGAKDVCLPCKGRQYWTRQGEVRLQVIEDDNDLQTSNVIFMDDKRHIRCESALEIAVKNGYLDVVKLLTMQTNNCLNCSEFEGRVPFLTAIKYGRYDIIKYFLEAGLTLSYRCSHKQQIDNMDLSETEKQDYLSELCPLDATPYHLIAEYGHMSIFKLIKSIRGIDKAFISLPDREGLTPLHYAFCNGDMEIISQLLKYGLSLYHRSANGSSPIHSAAICGQYKVLARFYVKLTETITDFSGKYVSHYLAISFRGHGYSRKFITKLLKKEMMANDTYGNLPIHIAANNTNIDFLLLVLELSTCRICDSIEQAFFMTKNVEGKTALDILFDKIPRFDYSKDSIYLIQFSKPNLCSTSHLQYYNTFEKLIFKLFCLKQFDLGIENIGRYIKKCIESNNASVLELLYLKFAATYFKSMSKYRESIIQVLAKSQFIHPKLLTYLKISSDTYISNDCDRNKELFSLMEDKKRALWIWNQVDLNAFEIFHQLNGSMMNSCFDECGLNILHRAILGGNLAGFWLLLRNGMSLQVRTKEGKDVLQLAVENAPLFKETFGPKVFKININNDIHNYEVPFSDTYSYDTIISMILKKTHLLESYDKNFICPTGAPFLGFSHMAGAKGLFNVLEEVDKFFGNHYANCVFKSNISPTSLANFFNHRPRYEYQYERIWKMPEAENITENMLPLFMNIMLDFKPFIYPRKSAAWKCRFRTRNIRNTHQIAVCAGKVEKEFLMFHKKYMHSVDLIGLKEQYNFLSTVSVLSSILKDDIKKGISDLYKRLATFQKNRRDFHYEHVKRINGIYVKLSKNGCYQIIQDVHFPSQTNSKTCIHLINSLMNERKETLRIYKVTSNNLQFLAMAIYDGDLKMPYDGIVWENGIRKAHSYFDISTSHYVHNAPEFHKSASVSYWNTFQANSDPSHREMVRKILSSSVKEITKWKRFNFRERIRLPSDTPFENYEKQKKQFP